MTAHLTPNQNLALEVIRRHGVPTIREVAETAGIARSSAQTAVMALVRGGLVECAGSASTGGVCFRPAAGKDDRS